VGFEYFVVDSAVRHVLYNPLMSTQPERPLISIVIPNYNGAACLEACLQPLLRQTYSRMEILVVDNASRDPSIEVVRRVAREARILPLPGNSGFAAAVNHGVAAANGEWIAVLNNDTEAAPDWLAQCAAAIGRHPDASFLACRILDYRRRDRIYSAGDCFLRAGIGYRRGQDRPDGEEYRRETRIFSACGCAALFRTGALKAAHGFDGEFFAYLEDVELGLRMQAAGAQGYYVPDAVVYHIGGATSGGEFAPMVVRLRTRNAILLILQGLPGRILWRCLPMILAAQLVWLGRVLVHRRFLSYLLGLAAIIPLAPERIRYRIGVRRVWRKSSRRLWHAILESEAIARRDFSRGQISTSRFLTWYFRLF
jgi:GT2 family glycosyltransferase